MRDAFVFALLGVGLAALLGFIYLMLGTLSPRKVAGEMAEIFSASPEPRMMPIRAGSLVAYQSRRYGIRTGAVLGFANDGSRARLRLDDNGTVVRRRLYRLRLLA